MIFLGQKSQYYDVSSPQTTLQVQDNQLKFQKDFSCRQQQTDLKFYGEKQRNENRQNDLKRGNTVGGLTLQNFKTYWKVIVKRVSYWGKEGH